MHTPIGASGCCGDNAHDNSVPYLPGLRQALTRDTYILPFPKPVWRNHFFYFVNKLRQESFRHFLAAMFIATDRTPFLGLSKFLQEQRLIVCLNFCRNSDWGFTDSNILYRGGIICLRGFNRYSQTMPAVINFRSSSSETRLSREAATIFCFSVGDTYT